MNVNLFAVSSNQVTLVSLQQLINCLRSWLGADLIWSRIGEFDRAGNSGQENTRVDSLCVPENSNDVLAGQLHQRLGFRASGLDRQNLGRKVGLV